LKHHQNNYNTFQMMLTLIFLTILMANAWNKRDSVDRFALICRESEHIKFHILFLSLKISNKIYTQFVVHLIKFVHIIQTISKLPSQKISVPFQLIKYRFSYATEMDFSGRPLLVSIRTQRIMLAMNCRRTHQIVLKNKSKSSS
jgi:hypothetical protein